MLGIMALENFTMAVQLLRNITRKPLNQNKMKSTRERRAKQLMKRDWIKRKLTRESTTDDNRFNYKNNEEGD
jgi:hypothetical protein